MCVCQCKHLELRLEEERLFAEYEQMPKKRAECNLATATLPDNIERNRFRDVVPYEENRVELVPNKENNTGYINASHIKVSYTSSCKIRHSRATNLQGRAADSQKQTSGFKNKISVECPKLLRPLELHGAVPNVIQEPCSFFSLRPPAEPQT